MEDRVRQGDGTDVTLRFGDIPSSINTLALLIAYLESGAPADITASDTATVAGTPINKATMLDDDTAESLGLEGEDATVNNALKVTAAYAIPYTIPASAWSNGMVTLADADLGMVISPPQQSEVYPSSAAGYTTAQQTAWDNAAIYWYSQQAGQVVLKCYGTAVPTIDLPIVLKMTRFAAV